MNDPLEQVTQLTHNPTGLPGMSYNEQQMRALEDEVQYQKELAQNLQFAYGAQGQIKPAQLPDEKQLHYLFDTQPKREDQEKGIDWNAWTIDESEIMRHVQFGLMEPSFANHIIREYSDILILRQQKGKKQVAINASKRLHMKILASKSTIHEGRPTASEMILNPANKSEIKQTIQQPQKPPSSGFFGFIRGH